MDNQLKTMVAQLDSTCNDRFAVIQDIAVRCTNHLIEVNNDSVEEVERVKASSDEHKQMYLVLLTFTVEMSKIIDGSYAEAAALMRAKMTAQAESTSKGILAAHAVRRCEINMLCDQMKAAWHNILALSALRSQLLASVREGAQ